MKETLAERRDRVWNLYFDLSRQIREIEWRLKSLREAQEVAYTEYERCQALTCKTEDL